MTKPLGHDLRNTPAEIAELLPYLTEDERSEIAELMARDAETYIWRPLPGPQYMAYMSQADDTGYGGAAGGGKGLALNTCIPTLFGWTTMAEVGVGDVLLDESGAPCRVTAVSDVVHRSCFRLRFDDGAEIVADDVHRWVTFDAKERRAMKNAGLSLYPKGWSFWRSPRGKAPQIRNTAEINQTLEVKPGYNNHSIPTTPPLQLPEVGLPVDPFVLGAWLGDGSSSSGTARMAADHTNGDSACLRAEFLARGYQTRDLSDPVQFSIPGLISKLREIGVASDKHVPPIYLRGSAQQRLDILRGLMVTDGHVTASGQVSFENTNERLAEAVEELALSMGQKARKKELSRVTEAGKRVWRVYWSPTVDPFGVGRKINRLRLEGAQTIRHRHRVIVACDPVPSVPTKCIAVDSPTRQFLVGRQMIPTHNTDLMCGAALTQHHQSLLMRREYTQMKGIVQRMTEMLGGRDGYNGQDKIWRIPMTGRTVEFGSVPNLGDELNYQGRPRDLLGIDEATNFLRAQVVFLMGWVRTTKTGQRTRTINTFNPPTTVEGRWVIDHYGPWLDEDNLIPAAPGEIRWFAMIDGEEQEVENARQFVLVQGEQVFEFDPREHHPTKIIRPSSRTFIPSRISDNPFLVSTGYISTLQRMPEPLRSQMLYGDFKAGMQDDIWQVIPTAWVDQAMARWKPKNRKGEMQALGVDVARGGKDKTLLSPRYEDWWFDELIELPGKETPDGHAVAGQVVVHHRDNAPILIDVIGVGASPYDILSGKDQPVYGVDVRNTPTGTDKSGMMTFKNLRSQLIWGLRETLDPANNLEAALPPDPMLKKELCSVLWRYQNATCYVESREEIVARIGHSPDKLSALMLAAMDVPKVKKHQQQNVQQAIDARAKYDPFAR